MAESPNHLGLTAEERKRELDEYAFQQIDSRLGIIFRRINTTYRDAEGKVQHDPKAKGDGRIDREQLKNTLMDPKSLRLSDAQVAACTRHGSDPPQKRLDQVPYIDDMIWEVDETGDGRITFDEFALAYRRAAADRSGFEPRKLVTLIDFMLLDEDLEGFVTEDKILELMTLRYGFSVRAVPLPSFGPCGSLGLIAIALRPCRSRTIRA